MRVLLVDGYGDASAPRDGSSVAALAYRRLVGAGHDVDVVDLAAAGFDRFMSAAEREAYHHEGANLVTEAQRTSADLVRQAEALLVACPMTGGAVDPRAKSWFERVFVPGVSFTFNRRGRVTPALPNVRRIGLLVDCPDSDREAHRRSSSGRSLIRAARLNCHRFCRTTYAAVKPGDDPTAVVGRALGRW